MEINDLTQILLACGTTDSCLGVISLADLMSGKKMELVENVQETDVRVLAWCPHK